MTIEELAGEYIQAQRDWSNEFLRAKHGPPPPGEKHVTDGQARATADLAVDLLGARLRWEIAVETQRTASALLAAGFIPDEPVPGWHRERT